VGRAQRVPPSVTRGSWWGSLRSTHPTPTTSTPSEPSATRPGLPWRLHGDERGTISILTVFAVLALTMLLGTVMNMARQVDGKIRMQNAADAVAYSGGLVLARGMNTLAFTNHLLCETFAITAFLQEGRDQHAKQFVGEILSAWQKAGQALSKCTQYAPFAQLGQAITQKCTIEQQMVTDFSNWAQATSQTLLPMFQQILSQQMIPNYQQSVIQTFPHIAQMAVADVAQRNGQEANGQEANGRGTMLGALWQSNGTQVDSGTNALPVASPTNTSVATQQRCFLSHYYLWYMNHYLWYWTGGNGQDNFIAIAAFFPVGKWSMATMSSFGNLWQQYSCGQLEQLLQQYSDSNLPSVISPDSMIATDTSGGNNGVLDQKYMFIGASYWKALNTTGFKLCPYKNPTGADAVNFAQVELFVPQRRLVWALYRPGTGPSTPFGGGTPTGTTTWTVVRQGTGKPGYFPDTALLQPVYPAPPSNSSSTNIPVGRDDWSLLNQGWYVKLVPAFGQNIQLTSILQTPPTSSATNFSGLTLPSMNGISGNQVQSISPH
jgi:hypothetical protein